MRLANVPNNYYFVVVSPEEKSLVLYKNKFGLWRVSTAMDHLNKTKLNHDIDPNTEVQIIHLPYYGELATNDITLAIPPT